MYTAGERVGYTFLHFFTLHFFLFNNLSRYGVVKSVVNKYTSLHLKLQKPHRNPNTLILLSSGGVNKTSVKFKNNNLSTV